VLLEDIALTKDEYYILARSSLADQTRLVLKHSSTFLVIDRHGDIRPLGFEDHGLFHNETRFLSRLTLKLGGKAPPLLSSAVTADNDSVSVDLTNPDMEFEDSRLIKSGNIYLNRSIFLWEGCYYEHLRISNYGLGLLEFPLSFEYSADFADIFEVRGMSRDRRGIALDPTIREGDVLLSYKSLDDVVSRTRIDLSPLPDHMSAEAAHFVVKLGPHQEEDFYLTVSCEVEHERRFNKLFDQAYHEVKRSYRRRREGMSVVETSNGQLNDWIGRSFSDIDMMLTETRHGLYPYAGIPWYNTVFGRDGIITAFETLWLHPGISRGVLAYLAAEQATSISADDDAEPGKILHEERRGEMARLREVPFGHYYGTVDATPLFVMLAGHYYERTADIDFIEGLWPHIDAALSWIDEYGDLDKDGFVEYSRKSSKGLGNQGWKDSGDAVFHADGLLARPPIALCEVQAYVYEAKIKAARMASALGMVRRGEQLLEEADALRDRFLAAFWSDELGTYALALDGDKRPCLVRSSNAGHCLVCGIATEEHARLIVKGMLDESFFSGWGIRTIATSEARYNPMSYHNGSVWPHDNALLAFGMSRYNMKEAATQVFTGLFEASTFALQHRLPELFCGFDRLPGDGPTLYPVACEPQAWASAAIFLLLQACFGLSVEATEKRIVFTYPVLPSFVDSIVIKGLRVGRASVDVGLARYGEDVGINVLSREGEVDVVVIK
jgi:glycogen debranching enzyme